MSRGLLRRPLGGHDEIDGHGAPAPGDRVGMPDGPRGIVGEFGILVDQDDQRRRLTTRLPDALSLFGVRRWASPALTVYAPGMTGPQ